MAKQRIKHASAKGKGRELQDRVCQMVSDLTGIPWGREDDDLIQPRPGAQKGVDIILHGEALEQFPFSVECKSRESWGLPGFIRQARKNQKDGTDWLLVLKRKEFKKPIVVMDETTFFNLLKGSK